MPQFPSMSEKMSIYWPTEIVWKSSTQLKIIFLYFSVLNAFQYKQHICILALPKCNVCFVDQICLIYKSAQKNKELANGCKKTFYQCENSEYLQIWLLPWFPVTSEKCIIYRPFKHQKGYTLVKG